MMLCVMWCLWRLATIFLVGLGNLKKWPTTTDTPTSSLLHKECKFTLAHLSPREVCEDQDKLREKIEQERKELKGRENESENKKERKSGKEKEKERKTSNLL